MLITLLGRPAVEAAASDSGMVDPGRDGGLGLDPSQWRSVWYKGGSEPGVVTLNYLATTAPASPTW